MITELHLGNVTVDVIFKDIKNVHLSVHPPTGRVRISAPQRMKVESVRLFAISKLGWIKQQQKKLRAQERETPREYLDRESHYLWGKRYLLQIEEKKGAASVDREHKKLVMSLPPRTSLKRRQELLEDYYRTELKRAARASISKWEKQLGLKVERFYVQKMKTKWGSASPARSTVRLNLELAKKPRHHLDYVVLHEMIHFKVPDHGDRFVSLLETFMPNWRTIRQALNEAPLAHADWH